jgi:predicted amidophosphoribosyltransferase
MNWIKPLFNKKRAFGTHKAVCDCCGKSVNFSDCYYLCRECYSRMGRNAMHRVLIDMPKLRKFLLQEIVKMENS